MVTALQKACKQIMEIYDFDAFFDFVGVKRLPNPQLFSMLCAAVGRWLASLTYHLPRHTLIHIHTYIHTYIHIHSPTPIDIDTTI
jgi:hypothetical protein